jgi:hypothetical protein
MSVKQGASGRRLRPGGWATFTPMAFDGIAWTRIASPQQDARAAYLLAAATHFRHDHHPVDRSGTSTSGMA